MSHSHTLFDPVPYGHALTAVMLAAALGASTILVAARGGVPVDGAAPSAPRVAAATEPTAEHLSYFLSSDVYDRAYAQALPAALPARTQGLVLPHYLLAAPLIAGAVSAFPEPPTRVIVIGPDHLGRTRAPAVVSRASWRTPYGRLAPDPAAARLPESAAANEEAVFDLEHSVSTLVPFIKKSFPDAAILPVLVNGRLGEAQEAALAEALPVDERTLVIASVDFSHYQPDRVARFHDRTSRAALSYADPALVGDLEIDSPEALRVFLRIMQRRGALGMTVLGNKNSAQLAAQPDLPETTSAVTAAFAPADAAPEPLVTVLAVGDLMLDREVRARMAKFGQAYPFALIRGAEGRFFRGADIVTGNLEGAISARRAPNKTIDFSFDRSVAALLASLGFDVVSTANNHSLDQGAAGHDETQAALQEAGIGGCGHQVRDSEPPWTTTVRGRRVAMLCYNVTDNALDEKAAEAAVRAAAAAHDVLLVQIHWGAEYKPRPTTTQVALGRKLVEWGADAVIGHHPHVMEGMELWQGKPIFWSLGNFVFDQDWSKETQRGLALGLAIGERGMTAYLFPTVSQKSQPRLALGDEGRALLTAFAERSDLPDALREQAKTGILEWTF
ncbi:AmmeMemoRadiSam system protein B [Patescibacteria group bacterium]|nr:MAG: AmmeMemoRadiSam system protein B [Patescibacteria group bacterium]